MPSSKNLTILGIDPGLATTGYGIIKKSGSTLTYIEHGTIDTPSQMPFPDRLFEINKKLKKIISQSRPSVAAIEDLFFYKNVKTALAVGQARGVMLLTVAQAGIAVATYTPLQIKQALVGYGRAEKMQVQKMVKSVLGLPKIPRPDDAADALAAAICCAHTIKISSL